MLSTAYPWASAASLTYTLRNAATMQLEMFFSTTRG
jgi:hypothetical protein